MLRLYNTLTRTIEDFKPINPPNVGIYTCGPTVYREVHIGNFRTYLMADYLRRTLEYNGFEVTHIRNITDVGHMRRLDQENREAIDPVIEEALKVGKTPQDIAKHYTDLYLKDEEKLNIKKAAKYPKASEHVKEMIGIIKILLKKGLAYETDGTVYFDVKKFKDYGKLSGNTLERMDKLLKAVRISVETDKKDSVDFALWKKAESDRLMKWDSPFGVGFPGWHIECSAMSIKYLGDTFDIHTGGEDLIFPHHEDEIAQSEGASGQHFVNYWLHGGYLLVDSEKMSRSKGNVYTISDLENKGYEPLAFRYLTFMTHYRTKMNFTYHALHGAQTALNRLRADVKNFDKPKIGCAEFEQRFLKAINNDLNMPEALGIVWELVRSDYPSSAKAESLLKFDNVLGLDLFQSQVGSRKLQVPQNVMEMVREREELRRQKRYHLADQLRNKIKKMGYNAIDKGKGTEIKKI
ncbi:MAG: cysteine--tRNA ligase [Candidatus Levybacteria bacterium RIFCSPHIGHO2_02_FULL_37_13]|nr:MAG: cysteine--tRNA ligase [Candidatus Levybacteria bacterium RIFCSPHIGHO2_02_FULL_37_13]OGH37782.1 MAG: cysteine--tRNA ligase [Candidatus Levybacteria bacterium RIFCSPLOWO2_01_FULL_37_26]